VSGAGDGIPDRLASRLNDGEVERLSRRNEATDSLLSNPTFALSKLQSAHNRLNSACLKLPTNRHKTRFPSMPLARGAHIVLRRLSYLFRRLSRRWRAAEAASPMAAVNGLWLGLLATCVEESWRDISVKRKGEGKDLTTRPTIFAIVF